MKNLVVLLLLFSLQVFGSPPEISSTSIEGKQFSFYSNHDLQIWNSKLERAIITIHGSTRNADTYFKSIWRLAKKIQVNDKVMVISPKFKILGDKVKRHELVYSYEGWWIGDDSLKAKVSSFSVIDYFIKTLANKSKFPALKELIVLGHSAGGHLTQRLALGSQEDLKHPDLEVKYIVANPGTYAYLNPYRPVESTAGLFRIPRIRCAYNSWKYGLDNLNPYMKREKIPVMIDQFLERDVTYFLGEQDIGQVEQNCMATIQGPTRLARGKNFKAHLDQFFPAHKHSLIVVPGVGHTQYGMYNSPEGKQLLFNHQKNKYIYK